MKPIDKTNLGGVDLNLLVAFQALMQTRSVTKAAEALRIGQPAASHALKRLRALLDDPLFVRTTAGMAPTPRALALAEPIRAILAAIEATLLAEPAFDPAHQRRIFRVGANDYAQAVIAAPLLTDFQAEAPGCKLIVSAIDCTAVGRALERGDIDLAFGAFPELAASPYSQRLYREDYALAFDAKACGVAGQMTRDAWLDLPHAIMSTKSDYTGPIDELLRTRGEHREVAVSTPSFLAIPHLLKGRRLVAALPSRLARLCAAEFGLATCPPPFPTPQFDVVMLWNARTAKEPGVLWLRDRIATVCLTLA